MGEIEIEPSDRCREGAPGGRECIADPARGQQLGERFLVGPLSRQFEAVATAKIADPVRVALVEQRA